MPGISVVTDTPIQYQRHHSCMYQQKELVNHRTFSPEYLTVKICPKIYVCSICKYVEDLRQQSIESLYLPPEEEHTAST